jgi:hypothetical protein
VFQVDHETSGQQDHQAQATEPFQRVLQNALDVQAVLLLKAIVGLLPRWAQSRYTCPAGDEDWYRFELTKTMRLRIQLADLPADYDLYVFDVSGQFLWASTWGRTLPEEVMVRVPAGVYYIQLVGYAGAWNGDASYRLLVERVVH